MKDRTDLAYQRCRLRLSQGILLKANYIIKCELDCVSFRRLQLCDVGYSPVS